MNEADAVNLIKDCCDEIEPSWKEHIDFWEGDEERGYYNDMAVLSHYVVDQYSKGKTKDFKEIFNACENIYKCGDEDAVQVLYIGFIECILFISSHETFGTHVIEPWMGPTALKDYIGLRDAFDKMAEDKWASYGPIKKLYLTIKNKIIN